MELALLVVESQENVCYLHESGPNRPQFSSYSWRVTRLLTLTWRRRTFLVCGPYGPTRSRALFWCLHFWTVASFLMYFARSSLWLWRDFKLISYTVYITWTMRKTNKQNNMYNKKTSSCSRRLSRFACYYEKKKRKKEKRNQPPLDWTAWTCTHPLYNILQDMVGLGRGLRQGRGEEVWGLGRGVRFFSPSSSTMNALFLALWCWCLYIYTVWLVYCAIVLHVWNKLEWAWPKVRVWAHCLR